MAGSASASAEVAIIDEAMLADKVYEIRGQNVMLDFDLAEIYGYTTSRFNERVRENIARFDGADFMFQLTADELQNLMSEKTTSSWGGRRKPPNAFTEQGVYMLMTVLKGELAIKQSRALIRLFKHMKDHLEEGRGLVIPASPVIPSEAYCHSGAPLCHSERGEESRALPATTRRSFDSAAAPLRSG